jgi:hypothetical protein
MLFNNDDVKAKTITRRGSSFVRILPKDVVMMSHELMIHDDSHWKSRTFLPVDIAYLPIYDRDRSYQDKLLYLCHY